MAPLGSVHSKGEEEEDAALERQRSINQAVDEGHDADIPSNLGYVLPEVASPAVKKPNHRVTAAASDAPERDAEKAVGGGSAAPDGAATASEDEDETDDSLVVWWDGDGDPQNPYNWPAWRKGLNCGLVSCLAFLTPLASSIFAPGVPQLMLEFNSTNTELAGLVVSIYVLGFAFGPLLLAPLSEIYGRTILYHVCNVGFVVFAVACALTPSLEALIVFRFLLGIFGSCSVTNGGGTIADMIPQEKRATAMSFFTIGPLLGPIIGPVVGGFPVRRERVALELLAGGHPRRLRVHLHDPRAQGDVCASATATQDGEAACRDGKPQSSKQARHWPEPTGLL